MGQSAAWLPVRSSGSGSGRPTSYAVAAIPWWVLHSAGVAPGGPSTHPVATRRAGRRGHAQLDRPMNGVASFVVAEICTDPPLERLDLPYPHACTRAWSGISCRGPRARSGTSTCTRWERGARSSCPISPRPISTRCSAILRWSAASPGSTWTCPPCVTPVIGAGSRRSSRGEFPSRTVLWLERGRRCDPRRPAL